MLILSGSAAPAVPRRDARDADSEEAPPDPDDLFREQPVLRHVVEPEDEQDFFDV